jgi:hypothetical protein
MVDSPAAPALVVRLSASSLRWVRVVKRRNLDRRTGKF